DAHPARVGLFRGRLLTSIQPLTHTAGMERARRHQRALGCAAFGLLALVAELVGRSLTHRLNVGRHVAAPSYAGADYYPFLLAGVKVGVALMLAAIAWRFVRARAAARAGRRLLAALGKRPAERAPRVRDRPCRPRLRLIAAATSAALVAGIRAAPPLRPLVREPTASRARLARADSTRGLLDHDVVREGDER